MLSTFTERVRGLLVALRPCAAGASSRVSGRAARTKGRMSSRMVGVASRASRRTFGLVSSSAWKAGISLRAAGPRALAKGCTWRSVVRAWESVPGSSCTVRERFSSSDANARKVADEESTSWVRSSGRRASSRLSLAKEEIVSLSASSSAATALETRARSRKVGWKRRNTSARSEPRLRRPPPAPLTRSWR